jgi:sister chromatid cohesion protein DCC1
MPEYDISFSSSSSAEGGSFKLLELPKDLSNLLDNAIQSANPLRRVNTPTRNCSSIPNSRASPSLTVKGQANEDAVLCTNDKTFTMRSVILSNSVLVVTSSPDSSLAGFPNDEVVIRDQVNEIMELTPSVPKLHKLATLLRGREYDEGQEEKEDNYVPDNLGVRSVIHANINFLEKIHAEQT